MYNRIYNNIYSIICAALLMLCGCTEGVITPEAKNATLKLRLNAPSYTADVRSVSSDPDSPEQWTKWERAVDGRFLYRVTAFILQGDRLVAHKDIRLEGEQKEVDLSFEANFTHGTYTLMIVANYSAFESEDGEGGNKTYEGLSGFSATVENILSKGTIDNFTQTYADSFMKYQIESEEGVCRRMPQPLTLVKEIELHPGTNIINGELIRTYSRVRIAVENNSDEDLMLSSMSFGEIFTQSKAYLFEGNGFINSKTAINVGSENALTPFTGSQSNPMVIPAKGISVVFDAYILESSKSNANENYSYSLGLGYDLQSSYTLSSNIAITKKADISPGHYLIYSRGGSRYLKAGTNSVEAPSNTLGQLKEGQTIPKEYVWVFDNVKPDGSNLGSDCYYIGTSAAMQSGETAYYMNDPTNSAVTLGANKTIYFQVGEAGRDYLTFASSSTSNTNYKYLYVNNGKVQGYSRNSNNAQFRLYPVEIPASSSIEIPLKTIDHTTGQAIDVDQISRNDFINAVVKVTYSKNQGHFIYELKDWQSGGGDVEFN